MGAIVLGYAAMFVMYGLFVGVPVWRAATKYKGSVWWAALVKLMIISSVGVFIVRLVQGGW